MSQTYDIAIVGGGPGGYVAAIRARQCGLSVLLIERENLGGICLNWGCIPTKALLRTADLWRSFQEAEEFGLHSGHVKADYKRIVARSRAVAGKLEGGVEMLMKKNGVEVRYGSARLGADGGEIVITEPKGGSSGSGSKKEEIVRAKHIILATGARSRELPILPIDGEVVWGYRDAMVVEDFPKSLCVAGAGAIGLEFASYFAAFGVEVTVVESAKRILIHEDEEIVKILQMELEKRDKIKFLLGTTIEGVEGKKGGVGVRVILGDGSSLETERVLSAVGVVGNVEGLGLGECGVVYDEGRGVIEVDEFCRTSVAGIYAIGDVAGAPMLAHKASHEGVMCIEAIAGEDVLPLVRERIPSCVYTSPQVASVGMSERAALAEGCRVRVGRFPLSANGKAISQGDTSGMVKVIFEEDSGAFLGASMVGMEVTEMVQGFGIALEGELTEAELMRVVFAHPTISEAMHEAVLDGWDRAVHVPPRS